MINKLPKILLIFFGILITANLLFLDWRIFKGKSEKLDVSRVRQPAEGVGGEDNNQTNELALDSKIATDSCGIVCQKTIEEKINEELAKIPSPAGQSSVAPLAVKPKPTLFIQPTSSQTKVAYVSLSTSGSATSISWTEIVPSEFYFDLSDYPDAKEVRFQAYLLSSNNDVVFARLYDTTNNRGVDYSDIQTTSSSFTRVESSGMKIWRGNNKYIIQLRSVNGTQVLLKEAKLKITF